MPIDSKNFAAESMLAKVLFSLLALDKKTVLMLSDSAQIKYPPTDSA